MYLNFQAHFHQLQYTLCKLVIWTSPQFSSFLIPVFSMAEQIVGQKKQQTVKKFKNPTSLHIGWRRRKLKGGEEGGKGCWVTGEITNCQVGARTEISRIFYRQLTTEGGFMLSWNFQEEIQKKSGRNPKKSERNPIFFHLCSMKTDITAPSILYTHFVRFWFYRVAFQSSQLHQSFFLTNTFFEKYFQKIQFQKIHFQTIYV